MDFPPTKIKIMSDGNELSLLKVYTPLGSKAKIYSYTYTKSKTKKGMVLDISETELTKLIKINTP